MVAISKTTFSVAFRRKKMIEIWLIFHWVCFISTDNNSRFQQAMMWYGQATSRNLGQNWPSFMTPYGVIGPVANIDILRPQRIC